MRYFAAVFLTTGEKTTRRTLLVIVRTDCKSVLRFRLRSAPKLAVQPGASVIPVTVGRCGRDANGFAGLFHRQAGEVTQLDESCRGGIGRSQFAESVVDGEKLIRWGGGGDIDGIDIESLELAPALFATLLSRAIHQDAPHRFGSGSEKVPARIPLLHAVDV